MYLHVTDRSHTHSRIHTPETSQQCAQLSGFTPFCCCYTGHEPRPPRGSSGWSVRTPSSFSSTAAVPSPCCALYCAVLRCAALCSIQGGCLAEQPRTHTLIRHQQKCNSPHTLAWFASLSHRDSDESMQTVPDPAGEFYAPCSAFPISISCAKSASKLTRCWSLLPALAFYYFACRQRERLSEARGDIMRRLHDDAVLRDRCRVSQRDELRLSDKPFNPQPWWQPSMQTTGPVPPPPPGVHFRQLVRVPLVLGA